MFSFFKRSKKENTSTKSKNGNRGEKTNKEVSHEDQPTYSPKDDVVVSVVRNNILAQKTESAPTENSFQFMPNVREACASVENSALKNTSAVVSPFGTNADMNVDKSDDGPPLSYAKMLKKLDNPSVSSRTSCVKPCGHGTVGIVPRMPTAGTKRENSTTPPSSPQFEIKKSAPKEQTNVFQNPKEQKLYSKPLPWVNSNGSISKRPCSSPSEIKNEISEAEKKNLINQEAKFQSQLNELTKQLSIRDAEANKLRFQMEELQRDVFAKSAGMDRLEAELQAAHKETEITKQRIRYLENDLIAFRSNNSQFINDLEEKSRTFEEYESEAKEKIAELEQIIKNLQAKIITLEEQIETLRMEKHLLEQQHSLLKAEREEEQKRATHGLEQAAQQKQEIEIKWKNDFEKLRTINILKEQQLLDDFEWKLREVQQTCKQRLADKDKNMEERVQEAVKHAEIKMKEAEEMMIQVENLKSYEVEVEQLRGLTVDQENALKNMMEQQEQMKLAEKNLKEEARKLRSTIELEKENLQHIQRIHHQELLDKERKLQQTLHEKRMDIARYWENKLLHEISRLKYELEQVYTEEQYYAIQNVKREKEEEFETAKNEWENRIKGYLKEIETLKKLIVEKDFYFQEENMRKQTKTDRDVMELRRLMDKIDMTHHERFEKLVLDHDEEIDNINKEQEKRVIEIETSWQQQVTALRKKLDLVKDQMEQESQQKIQYLIEEHRVELDSQWENLKHQKQEAINLVENEFVTKYQTLDEQFLTQQKSHEVREIELLKTIDSLKNELESKHSTVEDLQNNVDTLEGGIQILNQEIAQQSENILKNRRESEHKIRNLQECITNLHKQQEDEREAFRLKLISVQKQSQEKIDHLQRRCSCLTKLFEEVRLRYERRESRQEDLNIISDLRQVIAEQEKDLACINEEKRYFQMRLMTLQKSLEGNESEEEAFEDAEGLHAKLDESGSVSKTPKIDFPIGHLVVNGPNAFSIPPTIEECDDCDE